MERRGSSSSQPVLPKNTLEKYQHRVEQNELFTRLRGVELFASLTEGQLRKLMANLEPGETRRGKWVFRQGDSGECFYIIAAGEAEVVRSEAATDGKTAMEQRLASLGQFATFGERALLTAQVRFAGVRAVSQVLKTLSISKTRFEELLGPLEQHVQQLAYGQALSPTMKRRNTLGRMTTLKAAGRQNSVLVNWQGMPKIRRLKERPKHQPKQLIEGGRAAAANAKQTTFDDVQKADAARKRLLALARDVSPMDSILRLAALPRTVLPRILSHSLTWCVILCYAGSTIAVRIGTEFGDLDLTAFDGSTTLITFMIIFYVGCTQLPRHIGLSRTRTCIKCSTSSQHMQHAHANCTRSDVH